MQITEMMISIQDWAERVKQEKLKKLVEAKAEGGTDVQAKAAAEVNV